MLKALAALLLLIGVLVYASFGTISPCGILRETVRKQGGLAAILPDSIVDAFLVSQLGSLTPGRCLALLLDPPRQPQTPPASSAQQTAPPRPIQPQAAKPTPALVLAAREAETAVNECRAKRLNGIFKTFEESARCAGDRIMQAYSDADYQYMDLIAKLTAGRIAFAEMVDRHQITEAQAQLESRKLFAEIVELERQRQSAANDRSRSKR